MKQKILLINPPCMKGKPPSFFPLGLGYIAKALINNSYQVEILDLQAKSLTDQQIKEQLTKRDYNIVGISAMITQLSFVTEISKLIKSIKPETKIITGGLVNCRHNLIFKHGNIDYAILGEGEITIIELLQALENNSNINKIKGIAYKSNNKIVKTSPRPLQDLNQISFPAWDLFNIKTYKKCITTRLGKIHSKMFTKGMEMIMSRGCPFKCSYCFKPFKQIYRLRDTNNVIEEIKQLKKLYKINFIHFKDDLFVFNKKWVREFCNKLIENKIKITWDCCGKIGYADLETLNLMKKAGCICIAYGLESASEPIIKEMNKSFTLEQARQTIQITKQAKITPVVNIMFGMPSDNQQTLQDTVNFIKEMDIIFPYIAILSPLPETPIWEYALKNNLIKDEENYLLNIGKDYNTINTRERVSINLTKLSSEELMNLRAKATNEMKKTYKKNHPIKTNILYKGIKILLTSRPRDILYVLKNKRWS